MVDKKKIALLNEKEDQDGEGTSGQQGHIEFHDFYQPQQTINPEQLKHQIAIYQEWHEVHVAKQKSLRDLREAAKKGEKHYGNIQQPGLSQCHGSHKKSQFKDNPALHKHVYFSSISKQENPNVALTDAITNEADRNELQLQNRLINQPRFNPKPRPGY